MTVYGKVMTRQERMRDGQATAGAMEIGKDSRELTRLQKNRMGKCSGKKRRQSKLGIRNAAERQLTTSKRGPESKRR